MKRKRFQLGLILLLLSLLVPLARIEGQQLRISTMPETPLTSGRKTVAHPTLPDSLTRLCKMRAVETRLNEVREHPIALPDSATCNAAEDKTLFAKITAIGMVEEESGPCGDYFRVIAFGLPVVVAAASPKDSHSIDIIAWKASDIRVSKSEDDSIPSFKITGNILTIRISTAQLKQATCLPTNENRPK